MKYEVRFTGQFKKDLKLAKKQGKDLEKLYAVIERLSAGETLDARYQDHELIGKYRGTCECRTEPDWLLIYEYCDEVLVLMLYRISNHSEIFKRKKDLVSSSILLVEIPEPFSLCRYAYAKAFSISA